MKKTDLSKPDEENTGVEPNIIEPSIQEQIISEMLKGLKDKPEFPPELFEKVNDLAISNQLQKNTEVSKVIKSSAGGSNAAA